MAVSLQTPGVYVNEVNAFPNSVVPVATAIPVFIGYTQRADYKGKSYVHQAVKIQSFQNYLAFFGAIEGTPVQSAPSLKQYTPVYHAVPSKGDGDLTLGGKPFDVLPDPATIYHLYNSIRLFYQNGGGTAYIVSTGLIPSQSPVGKPLAAGMPLVNPNVVYADLLEGLQVAAQEQEITIIVIPDAVLLKEADHSTLMQDVLTQCGTLTSRVGILDVYGAQSPDAQQWNKPGGEIERFRTNVGTNHLDYGIAYFPFLKTTIVQDADINFLNLGGVGELAAVLPNTNVDPLKSILAQALTPPAAHAATPAQVENSLIAASPEYNQLHDVALAKINTLPPSAAMAGVYTMMDNAQGPWQAPANVGLAAVTDTTVKITDADQGSLNVDAATGKSINAIRLFPGRGVMVWGARTLDGNSMDWRYINVRRTMIMIEQSIKAALQAYVFEPNTSQTWSLVQSMISSFLSSQWKQGALAGPTAASAYDVAVGLGITMTADDILNGFMNVSVRVAITHPAEFIVINFSQQMQN